MPLEPFTKFGFSAGVLDPVLHGRPDLQNYDLGLAEARNFAISYLGGAFVRGGLKFVDYVQWENEPARVIPFQFNQDAGNTYCIVMTKNRFRFVQDGAYILESAVSIDTLSAIITIASHGFSDGDWLIVLGETYEVDNATTNTFTLKTPFGVAVNLTGSGATSVERIYTVAHSYDTADLFELKFDQLRDVVYINHPDYAEQKLTRMAAANWTLAETNFAGYSGALATSPTVAASTAGNAGMLYAITAVDENGVEGPPVKASFYLLTNSVNHTATAGSIRLTWTAVNGAVKYNVYRSLVLPDDAEATIGMDFGYIGQARAPIFVDNNIVPDFTRGFLFPYNPFANGAIYGTEDIASSALAFTRTGATISVPSGGGSGFVAIPIVYDGDVISVRVLNAGSGYTSPTIRITQPSVGQVDFTDQLATPLTGNNPACGAMIQQRRVRGGTSNNPNTVYGSRVGEPDSYFRSDFGFAADPFELSIDAAEITPIRHIAPAPEGMFIMYDNGVDLIRGVDDEAVTVQSAKRTPQTQEGSAHVKPLRIVKEVVYLSSDFASVQSIGPGNLPTYFTNTDRSIFSAHYFKADNPIVDWCFAKAPYRLIWAVRADGTALSCAYTSEQQVHAWSDHTTEGLFKSIASLKESGIDRVYTLVQRNINGQAMMYLETIQDNQPMTVEDMWAVDSGLRTTLTKPTATLTLSGYSGTVTAVASSGVFTSGDVGKHLRVSGARGEVTAFVNSTTLTVRLDTDIPQTLPELTAPPTYASGSWSLTALVSTVSGLAHLEGEVVDVLADGGHQSQKTVSGGSITLDEPASYICVGLPFDGKLKTLPLSTQGAIVEHMKKRPVGLAVRLLNARGLKFGDGAGDIVDAYEIPPRTNETFGVAPNFLNGRKEITLNSQIDLDGAVTVHKTGPHSGAILGMVMEVNLGPS